MSGERPSWWLGPSAPTPRTPRSSARAAGRDEPALRVSDGRSAYSVFVSQAARRQILRQDLDSFTETGGALFGVRDGHEIVVGDAIVAVYDRQARSADLDLDVIDRMSERHARATGWTVVGTWHAHVHRSSTVDPSPPDLKSWASRRSCAARNAAGSRKTRSGAHGRKPHLTSPISPERRSASVDVA